jgi:hypothetical protein
VSTVPAESTRPAETSLERRPVLALHPQTKSLGIRTQFDTYSSTALVPAGTRREGAHVKVYELLGTG